MVQAAAGGGGDDATRMLRAAADGDGDDAGCCWQRQGYCGMMLDGAFCCGSAAVW